MRTLLPTLALLGFALGAAAQPQRDDLKLLQGDWIQVRSVKDGKETEGTPADALVVRIAKDAILLVRDGKVLDTPAIRIKLETNAEPRLIDVAFAGGPTLEGIYKIEGKRWTVCLQGASGAKDRPTAFEAPAGSDKTIVVLEKKD